MKILFLFLSLYSFNSWSQGSMCKVPDKGRTVFKFKQPPNYFFKISPDGKLLYYISNGKNWVVDLSNGQETQLPGQADPVPSSDGKLLTYIARNSNGSWSMSAQRMTPAWQVSNEEPTFLGALSGSYQSVSRPMADGSRILFFGDDTNVNIAIRRLTDVNGEITAGPEVSVGPQQEFRLPMMSEDGTMFTVLNVKLNKTQVYKINTQTLKPTLVATLPIAAGKANFSYDLKNITFHLTRSYNPSLYADYEYPPILGGDGSVRNVYSYNIASKKITQITDNADSDSYFPIYSANNNVYYVNRAANGDFSLIQSKATPKASERTLTAVKNCYGEGTEEKLAELGELWVKACKEWEGSVDADGGIAFTSALNMSSADCRKLAGKDKQMLRLCNALDNKKEGTAPATTAAKPQPKPAVEDPGKKIFQNRCAICHEGQTSKIAGSASFDERVHGSKGNRMPPSGPLLSSTERAALKTYLSKFKR